VGRTPDDAHADVCLDALSLLLLLAARLPPALRGKLTDLLLARCSRCPTSSPAARECQRVPAVRQYAFTQVPGSCRYRDHVQEDLTT